MLADDHHIVRKGLRALLEAEKDFSVVGEVADGLAAVDEVTNLKPDILVLDLMMPGLNGLEVARQVQQRGLSTRVIVMSMHASEAYVMEALKNGVSGYLLKNSSMSDIIQAVRQVIAGLRYLSPLISQRAIDLYTLKAVETEHDDYDNLTDRERQVLHLAAEGLGNNEIAAKLTISPRTVETHRAHFMEKLNLRSQTDLIRYALNRGLIE
jgi:DNA-binding NarL/FixJ family response regulator